MNCVYCGYFNESKTSMCGRCGADLPDPTCQQCGVSVEWGNTLCGQCENLSISADKTPCPSCGSLNNVSAEYCTSCGTPMAVITRVTQLSPAQDRPPLETWRVYGIETQMVGRDAEMARLEEGLDRTIEEEHPRVVSVTGETGLGKSRLVAEFERRVEQQYDETVVMKSASRDDSTGPFGMFSRLFKNRYYIAEDDHPATARRKFVEAVESIVGDDGAERIAHLVGHSIGLPFDDSPYTQSKHEGAEETGIDRAGLEAVVELLAADAGQNPLIVVLEDLQHAKSQSLRLLDHLIDRLDGVPIYLLLTWNPAELFHDQLLDELDIDEEVELRPLADKEVQDFVRQTLRRSDNVPDELVDRIVDAAHGNPLSVEEMLRILISDGVIDTRSSDWTIHEDRIDAIELPATVEETVKARLQAMTDDEQRVLEMASTIGDTFWPGAVDALFHQYADHNDEVRDYWFTDELDERIDEVLESLERKDMIRRRDETTLRGHEEFYFKHGIERRTVYGQMAGQTKQRYHRLTAQWLERQVEGDVDAMAEKIAEHYDRGHCLERAARMYIRAADFAADRYANQKAIDLYTKGLGYLSDADIYLKIDAFHDLGNVYERRGEYDHALAYFREMLRFSWLINDPAKAGAALNKVGRAYRGLSEYDDALEKLERALDLFWEVSDLRGVASTLDDIGKIYWFRGHYEEALRYYSAGLELRREAADDRSVAYSLSNLGSLKLQRGSLNEAMSYYREALELREGIDDKQGVADSYNTLGALCVERGNPEDAITLFEEALGLARDIGHRVLEAGFLNNLGEAYLKCDRIEEATERLEEAREAAVVSSDKRILFDILRNLGQIDLQQERYERAEERISEAIELAEALESQPLLGRGHLNLADVYADWSTAEGLEERAEKADEHYQKATDLLRHAGTRATLGRCLSNYGDFLIERDEKVRGKQKLERAHDIFEQLEIRKLREATEQAIEHI